MPLYDIIYCMKQVEPFGRQLRYRSVNILICRDIQIKLRFSITMRKYSRYCLKYNDILLFYRYFYSINTFFLNYHCFLTVPNQMKYKTRNKLKHCITAIQNTNINIRGKTSSFTSVDLLCLESSSTYTWHILFKSLKKTFSKKRKSFILYTNC